MSAEPIVLTDFTPLPLQRLVDQESLLSYLAWLMTSARCAEAGVTDPHHAARLMQDVQHRVLQYGVSPKYVSKRQLLAFPDDPRALGAVGGSPQFPEGFEDLLQNPSGPAIDERMAAFERAAGRVFEKWGQRHERAPDDLIHVSCSGYAAPSPAQRYASQRGWYDTTVTHSYHMGCYGAFPAVRNAVGLLSAGILNQPEPKRRVDIVHTEYLSGHVSLLNTEPGNIIDMTLFGDGFIGYSAVPESQLSWRKEQSGLRVLAHHEELIPSSLGEMTWRLGPTQFEMFLSKNVPLLLRQNVADFASRLARRAGIDLAEERQEMAFAIHPGGPKILDHTRDVLGISEAQMTHSRRVFYELGNLCSATVPHILADLVADPRVASGTKILSMGFGPGLTASGLILQKV